MTTGEQGRTPPDAEHYLDLSGVEEDSPGPHFDVVLRGYDRRQVDEHVAGLRRMNAQLRAQLAVRERRRATAPGTPPSGIEGRLSDTISESRRSQAPGPQEASADESSGGPDMVGAFNDRLRGILQAAEQEAQLVRSKAAESLLAEHAESRAALADLRSQRDAVVDELVRLRGWLDEVVSGPGRPSTPPPVLGGPRQGGPWMGPGRPQGPYGGPRPPYPPRPGSPAPGAPPRGPEAPDGAADPEDTAETPEVSPDPPVTQGTHSDPIGGGTPANGTERAADG
jgi:syndecan 1